MFYLLKPYGERENWVVLKVKKTYWSVLSSPLLRLFQFVERFCRWNVDNVVVLLVTLLLILLIEDIVDAWLLLVGSGGTVGTNERRFALRFSFFIRHNSIINNLAHFFKGDSVLVPKVSGS